MNRVLASGAVTSAALFLLIACGAPSPSESLMGQPARPDQNRPSQASEARPNDAPSAPQPAATGIRVTGDGYAFHAPARWMDISERLAKSGQEVDAAVGEDPDAATTVRENLNVSVIPTPSLSLETYEQVAPNTLGYMIDDLETYDRVLIDGVEAVHVGGEANTGEASFFFEQYAVVRADTMYTLSFAIDGERSEADRRHLIDSVLASWEWQN
ncbi:hypothetical protein ASG90_14430 [Nocardioides sp. Soil797]|nr:hypothetical protein ASG90_14430 [Nocardioides sp. Soil797]